MTSLAQKSKNFSFQCFGVKISVSSNRTKLLERIKKEMPYILPIKWTEIPVEKAEHHFQFLKDYKTSKFSALKDDETIVANGDFTRSLDLLISRIRLTIAEFAEQIIFLHAGVIGWQNRAVIIPGKSFAGKTTLVAAFAKMGCEYFSDEYAMIDKDGLVHPFPKRLSIRGIVDDYTQVDFDVEKLGGKRAQEPFPVGCVLVAEYKKERKTKPKLKEITLGEGVMASIANSISIRQNPKFVIEVLNKALQNSVVLKTERGEAAAFVEIFFDYFRKHLSASS